MYSKLKIIVLGIALVNPILLALIPSIGAAESEDWMMIADSTTAKAGDTGHVIYIYGTWNDTIGTYYIAMRYDATKIEITDVSLDDGPAGLRNWSLGWKCYQNDGTYLGVTVVAGYPLHSYIAAGSGILLKIIANIKANAPPGITNLDLDQNVGTMPSYLSIFKDQNDIIFAIEQWNEEK